MKVARQRSPIGNFVLKKCRTFLVPIIFACSIFLCSNWGNDGSPLTVLTKDEANQLKGVYPFNQFQNTTANDLGTDTFHYDENTKDLPVIWSRARTDRSGAAIQDMLMAHAFAFKNNMFYGGACARNMNMKRINEYKPNHQQLLDAIGLSKVLRFRCPESSATPIRDRNDYIKNDTAIFTPQYLEYLQHILEYPPKSDRWQISVHIRRGDISPCRPRTRGYPRYLPNQHFLRLVDRYNPQNDSSVVIYSESESFESFDEFRNRGYTVMLDGSIGEVWRGILVSDVIILSRSSFSLVPAIMTRGKVVFTPFWHSPLPHWDVVEDEFVNETLVEFRRLKATCPQKVK
jgi:hypothetical protein